MQQCSECEPGHSLGSMQKPDDQSTIINRPHNRCTRSVNSFSAQTERLRRSITFKNGSTSRTASVQSSDWIFSNKACCNHPAFTSRLLSAAYSATCCCGCTKAGHTSHVPSCTAGTTARATSGQSCLANLAPRPQSQPTGGLVSTSSLMRSLRPGGKSVNFRSSWPPSELSLSIACLTARSGRVPDG